MRRIGDCELIRLIGRGAMGEVWYATQTDAAGASGPVAVKLMGEKLLADESARDRFRAEADLGKKLGHPNIVKVYQLGEDRGRPYMVMTWVDGMDLDSLARRWRRRGQPLDVGVAVYIVRQLLAGLAHAHRITAEGAPLGIVHRDVAPDNVLVSQEGHVFLTDFGVARVARNATTGQFVKGHARYMAPEQARGHSSDPRVDIFAAGALLQELLDGKLFRHDVTTEDGVWNAASSGSHPPLERQGIPDDLRRIVERMLAPRAKDRIGSAVEARQALREFQDRDETDLAILVKLETGTSGPRSDLVDTHVPLPRARPQSAEAATATGGRAVSGPAPSSAAASTSTRTIVPSERDRAGERRTPRALSLAVLAAALVSVGWVAWPERRPAPEQVPAPVAAPDPAAVAPVDAPARESPDEEPSAEPAPAPPGGENPEPTEEPLVVPDTAPAAAVPGSETAPDAGPAPAAAPEPSPGLESTPADGSRKPSARRKRRKPPESPAVPAEPVVVEFRLTDVHLAWVRVDRKKTAILEPAAKMVLKPGKHRLEYRTKADAPWQRGRDLVIKPDTPVIVRVGQSGLRVDAG